MKRIIFLFLLGLILSVSCNEKNTENSVNNEQLTEVAFDDLTLKLSEYNGEFTANNPVTKGLLGRIFQVVKADITGMVAGGSVGAGIGGAVDVLSGGTLGGCGTAGGTIIGGVVGGAAFSLDAVFNPPSSQNVVSTSKGYDFSEVTGYFSDQTGYSHNVIIQNILADDDFDGTNQMKIIERVIAEAELLGYKVPQNLASAIYENLVADKYILDNYADEDILPALQARYPAYANELSVAHTYLETISSYQGYDETVVDYTEGFIDIIASSQIPECSKEVIRASISVGANSSMLWREAND
ncbi:MAG: hypothetical protein LBV41_11250 [Cytophagaceae bacterium]|jgi:hypothetical protein|nr:hypothetical protein [Cytophagaceae bacterium]